MPTAIWLLTNSDSPRVLEQRLTDVLKRFDPATLEARLTSKSVLDALVPIHRKAKLWDLFTERYAQITAEAEDEFQRLLGKEFLKAYEAQVAR